MLTTGRSIERLSTSTNMKRRAEEALAADGVARTRLGYEVLVQLKRVLNLLGNESCVKQGCSEEWRAIAVEEALPFDGANSTSMHCFLAFLWYTM